MSDKPITIASPAMSASLSISVEDFKSIDSHLNVIFNRIFEKTIPFTGTESIPEIDPENPNFLKSIEEEITALRLVKKTLGDSDLGLKILADFHLEQRMKQVQSQVRIMEFMEKLLNKSDDEEGEDEEKISLVPKADLIDPILALRRIVRISHRRISYKEAPAEFWCVNASLLMVVNLAFEKVIDLDIVMQSKDEFDRYVQELFVPKADKVFPNTKMNVILNDGALMLLFEGKTISNDDRHKIDALYGDFIRDFDDILSKKYGKKCFF